MAIDDAAVETVYAVDPKQVHKQKKAALNQEEKTPVPVIAPYAVLSRREQAHQITNSMMAIETSLATRESLAIQLRDLKKQHKVGWDKLGVTEAQITMMNQLLAAIPAPEKVKVSAKTKALSQLMTADKTKETTTKPTVNDNVRQMRDKEIARLYGLGKTKAEISRATGISPRSVGRIIDKFVG